MKKNHLANQCPLCRCQNNLGEWLRLLHLEEYYDSLAADGCYGDLDRVTEITWEDLEEVGVKKLGMICPSKVGTQTILLYVTLLAVWWPSFCQSTKPKKR